MKFEYTKSYLLPAVHFACSNTFSSTIWVVISLPFSESPFFSYLFTFRRENMIHSPPPPHHPMLRARLDFHLNFMYAKKIVRFESGLSYAKVKSRIRAADMEEGYSYNFPSFVTIAEIFWMLRYSRFMTQYTF